MDTQLQQDTSFPITDMDSQAMVARDHVASQPPRAVAALSRAGAMVDGEEKTALWGVVVWLVKGHDWYGVEVLGYAI